MLEAVTPFPRPLTTPPVTSTYFMVSRLRIPAKFLLGARPSKRLCTTANKLSTATRYLQKRPRYAASSKPSFLSAIDR
jgi:hypothetical protein